MPRILMQMHRDTHAARESPGHKCPGRSSWAVQDLWDTRPQTAAACCRCLCQGTEVLCINDLRVPHNTPPQTAWGGAYGAFATAQRCA